MSDDRVYEELFFAEDDLIDHDHEGEAMAPPVNAQNLATWPRSQAGHQEQPVVIAFGDVKDPDVHFKQFGVISVYNGHTVGLGRIIADSSWHHWLNSNLSLRRKDSSTQEV